MLQLRRVVLALGFVALVVPVGAQAQLRHIVTKNISASSSGTMLHLEFDDEGTLDISFDDGTVYVDGDAVGTYEPGDELDAAWQTILGEAIALENGALAELLVDWTVPASIADELADAAHALDRALEDALNDIDIRVRSDDGSVSISINDETSLVQLLLGSVNRLGILEDALEGLSSDFRIHVDEDVVIPAGSVFDGTLVVIEGELRVEGRVEGDVVVVGGSFDLGDDGSISGEARVADVRVVRNNGEIAGGLVDVLEDERNVEADIRDRLREEIRDEVRSDLRRELRGVARSHDVTRIDGSEFSIISPFVPVIRGVGGVFEKLILVFILGLIGAGFLAFAGENMEAIAETARHSPGRSAMVGFAGSFLLIPVWLLGTVALVVSIIGIPVAIAWLPLFPLAAILAGVLGYVAVAQNTGEWLADSSFPWTGWIRKTNPIFTLFGGLLGLTFAFIAANVISIAPFLGILSGLLLVIGSIVTFLAIQIGFGAVILTRAGRRREYHGVYDPDAAWEAAMSVEVDDEEEVGGNHEDGNDA
jgi:hypothetical protein